MQLSIRHSFLGVLAATAMVAFATITVDFLTIRSLTQKFQGIASDEVTHLTKLKEISDAYAITIVDATHKAADGAISLKEAQDQIIEARQKIREFWQVFKSAGTLSQGERTQIALFDLQIERAEPFLDSLASAFRNADLAAVRSARQTGLYPAIDPLTEIVDRLVKLQMSSAVDSLREAEHSGAVATQVQMAMAGFLLILIAGGTYLIRVRVLKPIMSMQTAMCELAAGAIDCEVTGTERRDEIGDMARSVKVFVENAAERQRLEARGKSERAAEAMRQSKTEQLIGEFRTQIASIRQTLDQQLDGMKHSSETLSSIAMSAAEGANSAQAASSEASSNVGDVANAAGELTAASREISTQVHKASECVTRAMAVARQADNGISSLAELADRIGAIVDMINGIAEQTNMLALNATIEAARAGEAGRSFAVVASEVKTLAGQTAKATDEISTQVSSIQTATQSAVQLIRTISETVAEIQGRTTAIAAAVEEQEASTHEISRSISLASNGSERVTQDVTTMAESVEKTSDEANVLRETTDRLAAVAGQLSRSVDTFLEGVTQDHKDRRNAIRRASRELVLITNNGKRFETRAVDVSETGLRIECGKPLTVADRLTLEFLNGERAKGTVVWWNNGQAGIALDERIPQIVVDAMAA